MKNRFFFSENFQFLMVKFSIYLNRRVFVMSSLFHRFLVVLCKKYSLTITVSVLIITL